MRHEDRIVTLVTGGLQMKRDNVIDLSQRVEQPVSSHLSSTRLHNLKMRFEAQNGKIAVATTLLSIVVLVTMANNSLLTRRSQVEPMRSVAEAYDANHGSRTIASVPTGTTEAEDSLAERLAKRELSNNSVIGHRPSELERLSIGFLEGNYSMQLENGKLRELQFAQAPEEASRAPKRVEDLAAFIETNRALLPVAFSKTIKLDSVQEGTRTTQTYELVNQLSMPVAKVQFLTDSSGGLIAMSVAQTQVVLK
jgi:hypothetical protein